MKAEQTEIKNVFASSGGKAQKHKNLAIDSTFGRQTAIDKSQDRFSSTDSTSSKYGKVQTFHALAD